MGVEEFGIIRVGGGVPLPALFGVFAVFESKHVTVKMLFVEVFFLLGVATTPFGLFLGIPSSVCSIVLLLLIRAGVCTSFVKVTTAILICILRIFSPSFLPKIMCILRSKAGIMFIKVIFALKISMVILGVGRSSLFLPLASKWVILASIGPRLRRPAALLLLRCLLLPWVLEFLLGLVIFLFGLFVLDHLVSMTNGLELLFRFLGVIRGPLLIWMVLLSQLVISNLNLLRIVLLTDPKHLVSIIARVISHCKMS